MLFVFRSAGCPASAKMAVPDQPDVFLPNGLMELLKSRAERKRIQLQCERHFQAIKIYAKAVFRAINLYYSTICTISGIL